MLNILGRCFGSDHTWYGRFMWITISESALQCARHVSTFCKHPFSMLRALQSLLSVCSRPSEGEKYVSLSYSCLSFSWELEYHWDTNTTSILGFLLFFFKKSQLQIVSSLLIFQAFPWNNTRLCRGRCVFKSHHLCQNDKSSALYLLYIHVTSWWIYRSGRVCIFYLLLPPPTADTTAQGVYCWSLLIELNYPLQNYQATNRLIVVVHLPSEYKSKDWSH